LFKTPQERVDDENYTGHDGEGGGGGGAGGAGGAAGAGAGGEAGAEAGGEDGAAAAAGAGAGAGAGGEAAGGEGAGGAAGASGVGSDGVNPYFRAKQPLKPIRILEGMAASGLRAIRYSRELDNVGCVVANDLDPAAIEAIARNKEFNARHSADAAERVSKVVCHGADVRLVMMQHEKMFDAVDVDPYGTPSTLLDGAVQAVVDGGLLLCTATDMAVLCGNNGEVCWTKYGSYPLRAPFCHEQAVRILLGAINAAAGKYKRHIVPMLSVSVDFYVRCFVRVYSSAQDAKMAPTKVSYCYQCVGCDTFEMQPVVGRCSLTPGTPWFSQLTPSLLSSVETKL